ncbi:site-2 protease family protein [Sulfurovum sp. ST-21]|uniref:Site-2 protease family protein n=1 Tax=Sulfurovum indicum TaxID=2779528 RepID=A0A7M1S755_9BACT|nr:site-2 protease family protein [Sulfurovum indicum]QOR62821.1 site-2 protease family protein [Sulfurovum indicum]
MSEADIIKLAATIAALVVAIVGHEIMHGWVAYKYGDNTAKSQGRLSINPLIHVDPIGTLLVPAVLYFSGAPFIFGWAKPVPINIGTVIRNGGTNAAVAVSLAGITYNFVLAALCAVVLPLLLHPQSLPEAFIALFVYQTFIINILLGVFNLWPIPPLDGAQAVRYLAAGWNMKGVVAFYDKIYPYGMFILIAVLFTPLSALLFAPVGWIAKLLLN